MPLTNAQYDAVMRVYERRRTQNRRTEEERRTRAYAVIPELSQLDRQNARAALDRVRRALFGAEHAQQSSPMQLHAAGGAAQPILQHLSNANSEETEAVFSREEERRKLLLAHGFPVDWLDPVYTCPDCRDTGLIGGKHCHCFDREVVKLFYTQSGLETILRRENFDTLRTDYYPDDVRDPHSGRTAREVMDNTVAACRRFADAYAEEGGFLLLYGATGLGKTFLSHCIAKQLIDNGRSVIYYSAGELFDRLAQLKFGGETSEEPDAAADWAYFTDCDLLIIDDLGTELTNSFTASVFFRLLNERLAGDRGMVISTNLSPSKLSAVYTERIYSRIVERFTILEVAGTDIRVQKRLKGAVQS